MIKHLSAIVAVTSLLFVAACSNTKRCDDTDHVYHQAELFPGLDVPPGMEKPRGSSSLVIPNALKSVDKVPDDGCLIEPPPMPTSANS